MRRLPYVRRGPRASSNRNPNLAGENRTEASQTFRAESLDVNLNRLAPILERRFDSLACDMQPGSSGTPAMFPLYSGSRRDLQGSAVFDSSLCFSAKGRGGRANLG